MADDVINWPFVVECEYPGKKPFFVGTFLVEGRKPSFNEMNGIAAKEVRKFLDERFPDGMPMPVIKQTLFGSFFFSPRES